MKANDITWNKFYQKLGYLFYSIAASDKHIAREEEEMLHAMIKEDWVPLHHGKDEFGTEAAFKMEIVFDYLHEKGMSSESAYHVFESYFKENLELFGDDVVSKIYHTADKIADAFHEKNGSELTAISRMKFLIGREKHVF